MLDKLKHELAVVLEKETGVAKDEVLRTFESSQFSDLTTKVAFVVAKKDGNDQNPMEVANGLIGKIKHKYIERVESKGPYLNIFFNDKFYSDSVKEILKQKEKYGKKKSTKRKMMVEFFHANTHKGVHIGHIRNISIGESLCRCLEFAGNKVIRANFQGDIGPHVAKCLWGFINLYHEQAPTEKRGIWLGKVYAEASSKTKDNEELEAQVKDINMKIYAGDKRLTEIWKKTRQWCLDDFELFYNEFNVHFNELYFESQSEKVGKKLVHELLEKGIAKEDQGAIVMDLKNDGGLGVYILLTREGYALYSTKDLGLAKIKSGKYKDLDRSIHVVGKEQEYHFKQLFKTFEKIGMEDFARISYHLIYGLVMLPEGKMSSREGTMVLYDDLKDKVLELTREEVKKRHEEWSESQIEDTAKKIGLGAIKFSLLNRENNKVMVFDWDQALNLEGDSGPHVQYSFVRTNGILSRTDVKPKLGTKYKFNPDEKALIKRMIEFPDVMASISRDYDTGRLPNYLLRLSTDFNKFYGTSKVIVEDDKDTTQNRLGIVQATNYLLKSGLTLLNIDCPEKM